MTITQNQIHCAIDQLNDAIAVDRDDCIRRGIDNCVVTRVLPLAQDTLTCHRHRHVANLQQAIMRMLSECPKQM